MKLRLGFEYWPYELFYIPVYLRVLVEGLLRGSPTYFTAANPSMRFGGFVAYSKYQALERIPSQYLPKTLYYDGLPDDAVVAQAMASRGISFPVVAKPDHGERGFAVAVMHSMEELREYGNLLCAPFLIQELVPHEREYGVLYARRPTEARGRISSLVVKELPAVTGDGIHSLSYLIDNSERLRRYAHEFEEIKRESGHGIPKAGERVLLHYIGNHSRGTTFRSGRRLINKLPLELFDSLAGGIPGFFVGRFDIKAESFDHVCRGEFKVIEVNGVNSEPAHIYDPENGILEAYRDLMRHWRLVGKIAADNLRSGAKPAGLRDLLAHTRAHLSKKKKHGAGKVPEGGSETPAPLEVVNP